MYSLFVSFFLCMAGWGSLFGEPAQPEPLEPMTLVGMARTPPLGRFSQTLQDIAALRRDQSQQLMLLMHVFLGRLGFPHFEAFSASRGLGAFLFRDSKEAFHGLGFLCFDSEMLAQDPDLPVLYQGLLGQLGITTARQGEYLLFSRNAKLLERFNAPLPFKQLLRYVRHTPHLYDLEVSFFSPLFSAYVEKAREAFFATLAQAGLLIEDTPSVDWLSAAVQVAFEEVRDLDAVHVGVTFDDVDARLGIMGKLSSTSPFGTYLKAAIPVKPTPAAYLDRLPIGYYGRWNPVAYECYCDNLVNRLVAYAPASKSYLWRRAQSLKHEVLRELTGTWAGGVSLDYERIQLPALARRTGLDLMDYSQSYSICSASGLQASSVAHLLDFYAQTWFPELKKTLKILRPVFSKSQKMLLFPDLDFSVQLDVGSYLEGPMHIVDYALRAEGLPEGSFVLAQGSEFVGVLAQGIVAAKHEGSLRSLMERLKLGNFPKEGMHERLGAYPPKNRLFELYWDIKDSVHGLLAQSPILERGPYSLATDKRKEFIEKLDASLIQAPARLHIDKYATLLNIELSLKAAELRCWVDLFDEYVKALLFVPPAEPPVEPVVAMDEQKG